eukprot:CAMPEP_0117613404 /NCGR_PEP_ID=MMETSP0784-20121206/83449_1 /TAXON_ID=39447 /ORGANISM="" /LENGTH=61 /DNA_ID=CAMNT_0005416993 /DNA_START=13 /DNA_END=195 /DNA_ORIENTATION=-
MQEFTVQDLSNIAWAFATLSKEEMALFESVARMAVPKLGGFASQGLSNLAWAFATLAPDRS